MASRDFDWGLCVGEKGRLGFHGKSCAGDGGRIKIAWRRMKAKKTAPDEPAQPSFLSIRLEENVFV